MKLNTANQFMQTIPIQVPDDHQFNIPIQQTRPQQTLPITDAIQIRAAEYWLKLGEADEALRNWKNYPLPGIIP